MNYPAGVLTRATACADVRARALACHLNQMVILEAHLLAVVDAVLPTVWELQARRASGIASGRSRGGRGGANGCGRGRCRRQGKTGATSSSACARACRFGRGRTPMTDLRMRSIDGPVDVAAATRSVTRWRTWRS